MDSDTSKNDTIDSTSERATRPEAARAGANRAFSGVWGQKDSTQKNGIDDQIMSKGKRKAQERSPEDIASQAVDNGYDMLDEFLQQGAEKGAGDAFGIPEAGANPVGGNLETLLSMLAGGGGLSANVAGMYSQYLQVWNSLFATFLENVGEASFSGAEDISGMASVVGANFNRRQMVVLTNRPLDVHVHWKQGVPEAALSIVNLQSLDMAANEVPKGLSVKVRQSVDQLHQVFDVKAPSSIKAGRFSAILIDAEGIDHGYLTIQIP